MFERYTERSRRVIFFGRYEASQFGSTTIETEHLLLGLIREDKNLTNRFLHESIRKDIEARTKIMEKVSTSVDLPLSQECKRILAYAAEEAERLNSSQIGTEHLLLGILREEKCVAAQVLHDRGLKLEAIRDDLVRHPMPAETPMMPIEIPPSPGLPKAGVVPDAETAKRIAEALWIPLFGAQTVASQKPFQAELRYNIWIVNGSAPSEDGLYVFMLQPDGRVFSIGRGKPKS
jgi:hypothetical protein